MINPAHIFLILYIVFNVGASWSSIILFVVLLAVAFVGSIYYQQEKILYQPLAFPQFATPQDNPEGMRNPQEHNMPYEDVWLQTTDGVKLHCWFIRPEDFLQRLRRPTLIFFHANSGNMGLRLENLKTFYNEIGVNVFILSYRGYGNSQGAPSEEGLTEDALTTFRYLRNRDDVDQNSLVVFGRSLGGNVAIALAANPETYGHIKCVILENTFCSIEELACSLFVWFNWIPTLLRSKLLRLSWRGIDRIRSIPCPILFFSSANDEIVAYHHMDKLYEAVRQQKDNPAAQYAKLVRFNDAEHNTLWSMQNHLPQIKQEASSFISRFAVPQINNYLYTPDQNNQSQNSSQQVQSESSSSTQDQNEPILAKDEVSNESFNETKTEQSELSNEPPTSELQSQQQHQHVSMQNSDELDEDGFIHVAKPSD